MISYDVIECGQPLVKSERATPRPVGDQVLVRIEAAGVCHSDLHIWHGEYDLGNGKKLSMADRGMKLPLTMGHEIAGEVIAVGPGKLGEDGKNMKMHVEKGNLVLFNKYAGTEIKVDDEDFLVMREDDILAIIEA